MYRKRYKSRPSEQDEEKKERKETDNEASDNCNRKDNYFGKDFSFDTVSRSPHDNN